ncbi:MAG: ATP-grasp domain-containing protein [Pirellulaceae bacterium]
MRVAVLEWICGGGMSHIPSSHIPNSLRREGAAMLACLQRLLAAGGCQVASALDERFFDCESWSANVELTTVKIQCERRADLIPEAWFEIANSADLTLVVAPEFDRILENCISQLAFSGCRLLNCSGEFLTAASDKWLTSQRLLAAGIAHPPTLRFDAFKQTDANEVVLRSVAGFWQTDRWIVKPRDGAGCEQVSVCSIAELQRHPHRGSSHFVVQPLIDGLALSCSAIVDGERTEQTTDAPVASLRNEAGPQLLRRESDRRATWLPLFTQEFTPEMQYCGGVLADGGIRSKCPTDMLDQTLTALGVGARGWVGVDLLYRSQDARWIVIEVNPRCTTSIVGVSEICARLYGSGWLGELLLRTESLGEESSSAVFRAKTR